MSDSNKCLIVMVLDRSGSMSTIQDDVIGGVNTFLKDQAKFPGKCDVTLTQFDTEYEIVYQKQPITTIRPLDHNSFVPRGSTALLDAIGKTINSTSAELAGMDESEKYGKIYFVIITDGQENSSREYSREKVFEMISHHQNSCNWNFVFLASNQDAITSGATIGISAGNSMSYMSNSSSVNSLCDVLSKKMSASRTSNANIVFNDEDRKEVI